MLTGSIALSYYAQPRMTRDINLVAEFSGQDAKSVVALFAPDYYVADIDVGRALADGGIFNVLHLLKLVKLDFTCARTRRTGGMNSSAGSVSACPVSKPGS